MQKLDFIERQISEASSLDGWYLQKHSYWGQKHSQAHLGWLTVCLSLEVIKETIYGAGSNPAACFVGCPDGLALATAYISCWFLEKGNVSPACKNKTNTIFYFSFIVWGMFCTHATVSLCLVNRRVCPELVRSHILPLTGAVLCDGPEPRPRPSLRASTVPCAVWKAHAGLIKMSGSAISWMF